jgi:aminobenzoyl-glutamate transport protein
MDEILRYIWLHGIDRAASEFLVYVVLFIVSAGCLIRSKLFSVRDTEAQISVVVVIIVFNLLLILAAIVPNSPLLSVTGELFPSPWSHGLFQSLCLECVLVSFVFGVVAGTIRSLRDTLELFTFGIRKWPWTILLAMLVSFIVDSV